MLTLVTKWVRLAMMDFGFGSFLDKFESRFGKKVTTVLLVLIALSIASFCVHVTTVYVIAPTVGFFQSLGAADPEQRASIGQTIATVGNLIVFATVMASIINALAARNHRRAVEQAATEYDEFIRAANEFWHDSNEYVEAIDRLENEIEAARSAAKRRELVAELRARLRIRQADYATKISRMNDNIRNIRGK